MTSRSQRLARVLVLALGLVLPSLAAAHEVPADIVVQTFFKPEGRTLRVVLRVPLGALVNVDLPQREGGYVDFSKTDLWLSTAASRWLDDYAELYENGRRLAAPRVAATRVSLPSNKAFGAYETALAHLTMEPPLDNQTTLVVNQALFDVLYEFPIESDRSAFAIEPVLERLGIKATTVLRYLPPDGAVRAFEFVGSPGRVTLDPRWFQAALRFVRLGFSHILDGTDHLLFLLCLVIPFRRPRALVLVVSAFTVAHSITLLSSAYDLVPGTLWFPPLIETLIAASIVYMALENIVAARLERRWLLAFGFGLVHGFGFSFALKETLQFAGSHLLTSLVSFNLGVELGQLFVLALLVPALNLLFRLVVAERMGTIILSALVAHTGWHWMLERADRFAQYHLTWPALTTDLLLGVVRGLMLAVVAGGAAWAIFVAARKSLPRTAGADEPTADERFS